MQLIKAVIKNPLSLIGLILLLVFLSVAVMAPWLAPPRPGFSPYEIPRDGFSVTPKPPNQQHLFGTTQGQYDIYYGVVWGTRTALKAGLLVTGSCVLLGVIIGAMSAFYGGLLDDVIMRIVDIFMSFPFLVAALALASVLGRGLTQSMIAMITFGWMTYARLIRSEIVSVKQKPYVEASRATGAGDLRVLCKHILPNSIYPVFIMASIDIGSMVIWLSSLSFLGVGAPVGYADWGQLISCSRNWIIGSAGSPFCYWYTLVYPGAALFLFVLSFNLIGDALRDILDPRLRGVTKRG